MRILLLQDAVYFPSYGGGNKANRLLLEALAARGHGCHAIAKALCSRQGRERQYDAPVLAARGIGVECEDAERISYRFQGVQVDALNLAAGEMVPYIRAALERAQPDWILVSDDRHHALLETALRFAPERVVLVVHTHLHLPFGPEAQTQDTQQLARMRQARGIIAVSRYVREYLERYGRLHSTLFHFPVYGDGPFRRPQGPETGYVTMINPCVIKGLPIFLGLAAAFPEVPFAAVPTWGTDSSDIRAMAALPNIHLLEPAEDIDEILQRTRVLLAPSLIPETFGYVAVDAMLRGIPVLASDLGGLPEAKAGIDYLLPVNPAVRCDGSYLAPAQDTHQWSNTLRELISDAALYDRCSRASQAAALRFVASIDVGSFEAYLEALPSTELQLG